MAGREIQRLTELGDALHPFPEGGTGASREVRELNGKVLT